MRSLRLSLSGRTICSGSLSFSMRSLSRLLALLVLLKLALVLPVLLLGLLSPLLTSELLPTKLGGLSRRSFSFSFSRATMAAVALAVLADRGKCWCVGLEG